MSVKITKAGYVYIDKKKVLEEKLTTLSLGKFIKKCQSGETKIRNWVKNNYKMI